MLATDHQTEQGEATQRRMILATTFVADLAVLGGQAFGVVDGILDHFFRYGDADLLGRVQAHELPTRQAQIAAAFVRLVTPAAAMLIGFLHARGIDGDGDGAFQAGTQTLLDVLVMRHAERFGQHQRGDAMAVHAAAVRLAEVAIGVLLRQHEAQAALHPRALFGIVRCGAGGKVRHHRHAGQRGRRAIAHAARRFLFTTNEFQTATNGAVLGLFGGEDLDDLGVGEFDRRCGGDDNDQ